MQRIGGCQGIFVGCFGLIYFQVIVRVLQLELCHVEYFACCRLKIANVITGVGVKVANVISELGCRVKQID